MKKLMVLDGNSIVNRAFYGVSQNLTTRTGQPTNAILGFLNILNKLLDEEQPDALCVTFDRKAPTFRHLAYEGYKAQRKGMPDELASQMPLLKEVLAAMKIPFFLTPGYDDDLVAYGLSKGLEVLPGVLTPGDVQKALNRGVRRLKLFPADAFGMSYIKSLKGPFPQAEFVAVGGVNETNVSQFLKAGFVGAAAGSNLVPRGAADGDLELIRQKARLYVQAMKREV